MNRQILHLAIPSIVSNITVPLLGLVDVAITGHMGDSRYMAAIAVGSMVFNIIYWMFSFLRFGTGGLTAQAYGASPDSCGEILVRSQIVSLSIACVLLLLQWPLFEAAMWLIEPEAGLVDVIHTYFSICIWGTIPSLALYALTGWFVGMQNTKLPMVVSITQNIINIAVSSLLVYVFKMKIEGVALGTLIAQWCGFLIALMMVRVKYYNGKWKMGNGKSFARATYLRLSGYKEYFSVSRVLFLRTLFLVAVNLWFIVAGAKGGGDILSVNSVLMQMFILYTYVMDGFAFAAEALCGRYYGANDKASFDLALRGVWIFSIALTILYTLAYAIGGEAFLCLLTDNESVREAAQDYLPWAIAIPVCGIAAFVWDGVFVGITETKGMLWGTFSGAVAFFVLYYTLYPYLHNHALWLAFNAYLFMRGLIQHFIWTKRQKNLVVS